MRVKKKKFFLENKIIESNELKKSNKILNL
jgi:hypothetical protein